MSPPRPPRQRRAPSNIGPFNPGATGRKTGLLIPDTGERDGQGMESLDQFFSPAKLAGLTEQSPEPVTGPTSAKEFSRSISGQEHTLTESSMDIVGNSSIASTSTRQRQFSLPPRARSPAKLSISGTPRRGSSTGPRSSPIRSSPVRLPQVPNRRLDFTKNDTSAPQAARLTNTNGRALSSLSSPVRDATKKRQHSMLDRISDEDEVTPPAPRPKPPPLKKYRALASKALNGRDVDSEPQYEGRIVESTRDEDQILQETARRDTLQETVSRFLGGAITTTDITEAPTRLPTTSRKVRASARTGVADDDGNDDNDEDEDLEPRSKGRGRATTKPRKASAEGKQKPTAASTTMAKVSDSEVGAIAGNLTNKAKGKAESKSTSSPVQPRLNSMRPKPTPKKQTVRTPSSQVKSPFQAVYDIPDDSEVDTSDTTAQTPAEEAEEGRGLAPLRPSKRSRDKELQLRPGGGDERPRKRGRGIEAKIQPKTNVAPRANAVGEDDSKAAQIKRATRARKTTGAQTTTVLELPPPSSRSVRGKKLIPTEQPAKVTSKRKPVGPSQARDTGPAKNRQRVIHEKLPDRDVSVEDEGKRRSQRPRIAPLQFWKNEKIEYKLVKPQNRGEIAMPQCTGIIKVESPEIEKRKRPAARFTAEAKRKHDKRLVKEPNSSDDEIEDPGDPDAWETIMDSDGVCGLRTGIVKAFPPNSEEPMMHVKLAFSKKCISGVEVANNAFTFVKTYTEPKFGTGMIDIPPRGMKRPKNSGQMSLVFCVHSGRATVTIADNKFRIGKSGQFIVPRENLYSIENEFDVPLKLFFAQAAYTEEPPSEDE